MKKSLLFGSEGCRVVVLVDNREHPQYDLAVEHGLSIYIEKGDKRYLLDVGASDAFYLNAQKLGIDIAEIDGLFISHGHKDHMGGLPTFIKHNSKAKIYLAAALKGSEFFSYRKGSRSNISLNHSFSPEELSRFVYLEPGVESFDGIEVYTQFANRFEQPLANQSLYRSENGGEEVLDTFKHELALKMKLKQGVLILSACTHNGLLNSLDSMVKPEEQPKVIATIGGTHLLDETEHCKTESSKEIRAIARLLNEFYPNMRLITGHCTGQGAIESLHEMMGGQFEVFYSGWSAHY